MTKIDIISGFLGAGKTTLIKKLIKEAYTGEKIVLIENEFGEIGIDGGFLQDAGIEITEMNSGCICCSLVGDFSKALAKVLDEYKPDRIVIEPSGVGKLSDVIRAVKDVGRDDMMLNSFTTVADANKCKMYMKNFGEFYNDQVEHAGTVILSHTAGISEEKLAACVALLREHNHDCTIVTSDWDKLDGKMILDAMEGSDTLEAVLHELEHEHHHHHKHHHHDEDCDCGCHEHEHHHHHDEDCDCGCHDHDHHHEHHHEHGEDCDCGCHDHHHDEHEHHHEHHEHHHEHGEECSCGCHGHGHHHADEVFTSWGHETTRKYTIDEIKNALEELENESDYGMVLRAKGIVEAEDGSFIHFDYVPGEPDVRSGSAAIIGRLCVIGSNLNTEAIEKLFKI
ncbi:MAG: cobalamin biosynthesis protein CobW [Ruminococcaceae bacterium]|nr:cobalamin biosynthesis protein CobW [Oscillospiraceae bacterium]